MHSFKLNPIIFCLITILAGCRQNEVQVSVSETTTPQPTDTIQIIQSVTEIPPTETPPPQIDMQGFAVQIGDLTCALNPVAFYNLHIFQVDCGQALLFPLGYSLDIQLITPNALELPIAEIPDIESIFGHLEPPFVFGVFQKSDGVNTAVFKVPQLKYSGDEILCGFSIPFQGEDVYIVITGKTTRIP